VARIRGQAEGSPWRGLEIRGQDYPLHEWVCGDSGVSTRQLAARFLEKAEAKMLSLNMAPNGAFFRTKLAREACFLVKNRRFSGVSVYR